MADNQGGNPGTTTIIERNGSGGAGWLIAIVLIAALVIGGVYLMNQSKNDNARTSAITGAAKSVSGAADKAGAAVDKAAQ